MPQSVLNNFSPPEIRLTAEMRERLEELAPLFEIELKTVLHEGRSCVELSGKGFSEGAPLLLSPSDAKIRLMAEICDKLCRWIPFSGWEPAETTLFALPPARIERCAVSFRKRLLAQTKLAERMAAAQTTAAATAEAPQKPRAGETFSPEQVGLLRRQDTPTE